MSQDSPSYKLRVLKSWVSTDHSLIFQCSHHGPSTGEDRPKKVHLVLDLKQQTFGARIQLEKPSDATANHAFVQILRKYCPQFTIKEIRLEPMSEDIWIPLLAGSGDEGCWYLRLTRSRPPLASLICPDATVWVSFGQRGTFTKKHALEAPFPPGPGKSLLNELMLAFLDQTAQSPDSKRDEEVRAPSDDSPAMMSGEAAAREVFPKAQRELRSRLKRKLKTLVKTLEKQRADLPAASKVKELEDHATILQSYAYLIKDEAIELRLDTELTGLDHPLTIPLDPEKSKGAQIDAAFQAYHRAKRGREMGQKQEAMLRQQIHRIEADIAHLEMTAKSDSELQQIVRDYQLPQLTVSPSRGEAPRAKPFKTYIASTGHSIFVGKAALDNDELTKSARSNDYWLHAVGVTGSHVVIPTTADTRQSLPPQLLRDAAILALYFSKFKDDYAGECYVTRKAHIKKPKGMAPGLWQINKSETIFIRYTEADIQALLATVKL